MENKPEQSQLENLEISKLEEDFTAVLLGFSNNLERIKNIFKKLVDYYSQEGRHYHTLKHIQAMLAFLEEHKEKIQDYKTLYLATWYHDAIYDSRSKTNEQDSAEMMKQDMVMLSLPKDIIDSVYRLIMTTQKHEKKTANEDESLFLDADLSILSRPQHIYAMYCKNIRKEYAWVPEEDYIKGRKSVLQHFLNRPRIYFSDTMSDKESIARKNIEDEISQLK